MHGYVHEASLSFMIFMAPGTGYQAQAGEFSILKHKILENRFHYSHI